MGLLTTLNNQHQFKNFQYLPLLKIIGFHGGYYEKCRLLG
jgi:hypothetical protein